MRRLTNAMVITTMRTTAHTTEIKRGAVFVANSVFGHKGIILKPI